MDKKMKTYVAVGGFVGIALLLIVNYALGHSNSSLSGLDGARVTASQMAALKEIALNETLANRVGAGVASMPTLVTGKPLTASGKPIVVYVGADYCPFCAAQRWPLIIALMRFGNFSSLYYMTSSATDVYASTPTFTFYNATYSSGVIEFMPVETLTNTEQFLQNPNAVQNATIAKYDAQSGSIPFIDIANESVIDGASYSPAYIHQYDWAEIINQTGNPNSAVSQAIIGSADVLTAYICNATNYTPASTCDAPYVKAILG